MIEFVVGFAIGYFIIGPLLIFFFHERIFAFLDKYLGKYFK